MGRNSSSGLVAKAGSPTPCTPLCYGLPGLAVSQFSSEPLRRTEPQLAESAFFQPSDAPPGHACLNGQGLIWRGLDSRTSFLVSNCPDDKTSKHPTATVGQEDSSHPRTRLLLGLSCFSAPSSEWNSKQVGFRQRRAWAVPGFAPRAICRQLDPVKRKTASWGCQADPVSRAHAKQRGIHAGP